MLEYQNPEFTPINDGDLTHNRWYLGVRLNSFVSGNAKLEAALWDGKSRLFCTMAEKGGVLDISLMPSGQTNERSDTSAQDAFLPMIDVSQSAVSFAPATNAAGQPMATEDPGMLH